MPDKEQDNIKGMLKGKIISKGDPVEALIDVIDTTIESCMSNPAVKNSFTKKDESKIEKSKNEFFRQILGLRHSQ